MGIEIFKPQGHAQVDAKEPEDLAKNGIHIHPKVMEKVWGEDAVERYQRAVQEASRNR